VTIRRFFLGPICFVLGHADPVWTEDPDEAGGLYLFPCGRCGKFGLPHPFAAVEKPEDERVG